MFIFLITSCNSNIIEKEALKKTKQDSVTAVNKEKKDSIGQVKKFKQDSIDYKVKAKEDSIEDAEIQLLFPDNFKSWFDDNSNMKF